MIELLSLQLTMLIMILTGMMVRKVGIVGEEGQKNITDLVIYLILPCNIIKAFMVPCQNSLFYDFAVILIISIFIQIGSVLLGKLIYHNKEAEKKKCLQYGMMCSNAGFLGNPIAEGIYGTVGLTLASIYLIPQRIMMWSAGLAAFADGTDKKDVIRKTITHPCILSCGVGLLLMVTRIPLPAFLTKSITAVGNCNTAMSMMIIGMILAKMKWRDLLDKEAILFSVYRLILIPCLVWLPCLLLKLDPTITGVSVILAAMPAGATTSILASKYHADAEFATTMVVVSTVASIFTTTIWSLILAC